MPPTQGQADTTFQNQVDVITSCMKSHGVEDVEVMQSYNNELMEDEFTIIKKIGDKKLGYTISFAPSSHIHDDVAEKNLQLNAERAAKEFKKKLTDTFKSGGLKADVSMYDGGWAKCKYCGTEVDLPPPKVDRLFTQDAELSTPHPMPKKPDNYVSDMDGHQEVLLKMYLIGRLKEQCDLHCQNRYTQS